MAKDEDGCGLALLITLLGAFCGFVLGIEAGEFAEKNMWKDKIRSGRVTDLVNIVEKEDALEKARSEFNKANGR